MSNLIVYIYIGNQETAACLFNLRTKEQCYLYILPEHVIISTSLAVVEKGEMTVSYVGDEALYHFADATFFQESFDDIIEIESSQNKIAITLFLQYVYKSLLDNNQQLRGEDHEVVLITHWENKELLKELAANVGLPISNVYDSTVAALGFCLCLPDSPFRRKNNRSRILIIEIGEHDLILSILKCDDHIVKYYLKIGIFSLIKELSQYILWNDPNLSSYRESIKGSDDIDNKVEREIRVEYYQFARYNLKTICLNWDYCLLTNGAINGFSDCNLDKEKVDSILSNVINRIDNSLRHVKLAINYNAENDLSVLVGGNGIHSTILDVFRKNFINISRLDESPPCVYVKGGRYLLNKTFSNIEINKNIIMTPITEQTEFIIGIDFGHGETSARFYNLQNEEQEDIDILPGQKVIKSAVAILRQEGVETCSIGDSAINKAPMAQDFQVSFKKRPSEMTPEERKLMVFFMKGVYEGILDRHPDYKTRDHRVFIARPSNDKLWKNEEAAYLEMAEEAGLPIAGIQKESRAAYFRARTQPDSKIDNHVEKGVLIVDFGSSTIDFTYLNKDLSQPIDDGVNLGANVVETVLLKYSLSHPNPQDSIMSEFNRIYGSDTKSNAYNQLLYKFRVAKEEFYGKKLPYFSVGIDYSLITSAERQQLFGFGGITLNRSDVRKILESEEYGKYIPTVEAVVKKFKDEKLKDQKVECVYLTGGASRMDFVREIFMKIFNLREDQCPSDDTPSLIVSQGVAHLSYADYRTQEKEKELRAKAKKIIDSFDWEGKLKETIADSVRKSIIDKVYSIMLDYKGGRIYDYHTLKNGCEGDRYYGPMEGDHDNGFQKVRNIEALISKFESTFNGYVHYDFIPQCKSLIQKNVIAAIDKELRVAFSAFKYEKDVSKDISLTGLSAKMSQNGANTLKWRFTSEGKGHVLWDAVKSCWPTMIRWNKLKDRWDNDRKQHFDYYTQNNKSIYSTSSDWNYFIKTYISINGISSAKDQIKKYVDEMITEYISYAKLAIFFK